MNDLEVFINPEFGEIRTVLINNEPHFVGNDVAGSLEYARPYEAITTHCDGAVSYRVIDALGRAQETKVIPLGDVLRLIAKAADQSRNPNIREKAKRYESWIFDEVLPSIHKTGSYTAHQARAATPLPLQTKRVEIMERNSRTRQAQALMKIAGDSVLCKEARELVLLDAHQIITGKVLPYRPVLSEPLMSAKEIGIRAGREIGDAMGLRDLAFSDQWVGVIANRFGLKTEANGKTLLERKRHSDGQISSFQYNAAGYKRIKEILSDPTNWPKRLNSKIGT